MEKREFHFFRLEFQKTQKEMAQLLGTSVKAVQSFEQGWRRIPVHVERQLLLLHVMKRRKARKVRSCWEIRGCSLLLRQTCPAFEFHSGHLCWFINGTLCKGRAQGTWANKMKICRGCQVFGAAVGPCGKGKIMRSKGNGKGNGSGKIAAGGR
jgi:DNA-binding XRE family transcriptional regulator